MRSLPWPPATHHWLLPTGALLGILVGQWLLYLFGPGVVQVGGASVLEIIFGESRLVLSDVLLDKADEYFHGGVKHAACCGYAATHEHENEHEREHEHEHEHPHVSPRDLWQWINARVHSQEHRHLKGADNRELLPWLWGACRTSPKNIMAYESAAYVMEKLLNQPLEAAKLLREAISVNQESARLEVSLGEVALRSLQDPVMAEAAFTAARAKWQPTAVDTDADNRLLRGKILFYQGYLALQRHDRPTATALLSEAEAELPELASTRDLRKLLLPTQ